MTAVRWLFPTAGDVVAVGVWLLLGGGLIRLYRQQRREEREAARRPLGDRYQRPGWTP